MLVAWDLDGAFGEPLAGLVGGEPHVGLYGVGAFLAFARCGTVGEGVFGGGGVFVVCVVERHALFGGDGPFGSKRCFSLVVGGVGIGVRREDLADWGESAVL